MWAISESCTVPAQLRLKAPLYVLSSWQLTTFAIHTYNIWKSLPCKQPAAAQMDMVCSTPPHGWNMHLVRPSSFLLDVLLIITILCSHAVYHAATSDKNQCQCCCSVPKNSFMTDFQRGCWNNDTHILKVPLLRFLCTSLMSREEVSFFWLKNLELKLCRNLLYGPYNMQFSFLSACYWRRAMRVLMLGSQ